MVFAAVLRNAARNPEQAHGRDRAVLRDNRARLHSLARPIAGQVRKVPASLPFFLLGVCPDRHRTRLSRFARANGGARVDRAHFHVRLFRLLPHHHARSELYREDEADPDVDRRRGADEDEDEDCDGHGRLMRDRPQGIPAMIRHKFPALAFAAMALVAASALAALAQDEAEQPTPPLQDWTFSGMFGIYDRAQLQRGFQVYKEDCSTCHALSIPFRTLADPGGPGFSEDQVKTLAATYQVTNAEPNDKGEIFKRPATPADIIPRPDAYPNDQAAAAAFGKAPPDMALLAKALKFERGFPRFVFDALPGLEYQEMGADFIHGILTGYTKPDDPQWNLYYPGHKIAMPQPITNGAVDYKDGTPPTLDNYAKDIAAFLSWAAEPNLIERKRIGLRVMIFLFVFATLLYFTKKRIWEWVH